MYINVNIGFPLLLTVALGILKLTGVIAWSWWWIASPVIAYVVFMILILSLGWFAVSRAYKGISNSRNKGTRPRY